MSVVDMLNPGYWDPSSFINDDSTPPGTPLSDWWDGTEYEVPIASTTYNQQFVHFICPPIEQTELIIEGYFTKYGTPAIHLNYDDGWDMLNYESPGYSATNLGESRVIDGETHDKYRYAWTFSAKVIQSYKMTAFMDYPQGRPLVLTGFYLSTAVGVLIAEGGLGGLVKDWDIITNTETKLISGATAGVPGSAGYWVEETTVIESTEPVVTYTEPTYIPPTEEEPTPDTPSTPISIGDTLEPAPATIPAVTPDPPMTEEEEIEDYLSTTIQIGVGTIKFASWDEVINLPGLAFARDPTNYYGSWYHWTQAERDEKTHEAIMEVINAASHQAAINGTPLGQVEAYVYSRDYTGKIIGTEPKGGWMMPTYLAVWMHNNNLGIWTFSRFRPEDRPTMEIVWSVTDDGKWRADELA